MVPKIPQPSKTRENSRSTYLIGALGLLMITMLGTAWILLKQRNEREPPEEASLPGYYRDTGVLTPLEARYRLNDILEQAITAQGGRLFMERLSTIRKLGTLTQGESSLQVNFAFKRPNRLRYRLEAEDHGYRIGYDGSKAWIQGFNQEGSGAPRVLESRDTANLVLTSEIALPAIIFFNEPQYMSLQEAEEVEGHLCHVLKYEGPLRASQTFYIDQETFVLRKRARQTRFRNEDNTRVDVVFTDFRSLNGVPMPYREIVYFDDELQTDFFIEHITINPGIIDDYFTMPAEL